MSTKIANLIKQVVRVITDFIMMAKKKQFKKILKLQPSKKCFNYKKKGYYTNQYYSFNLNKRWSKQLSKKIKYT